jgi:RNA polymerase sigma-70 factor (ECF subfamily)
MALDQATTDRVLARGRAEQVDWDAVYAEQLPRVYNYLRFRLANRADVEDLTSRTFEKAWRARERYRQDLAGFGTWLLRIAHNLAIDHLRARRNHLPIDAGLAIAGEETLEHEAERDSDLARLGALTARLPERERELIALKYGAAIDNRLIARLTGLSESNVGTILHRVVRALRKEWENAP